MKRFLTKKFLHHALHEAGHGIANAFLFEHFLPEKFAMGIGFNLLGGVALLTVISIFLINEEI